MDFINSVSNPGLILAREQFDEMIMDVRKHADEEACGLIGGKKAIACKVYPITNSLHAPTRFRMDASEQVTALMDIERNGWDLLAIYHSHLNGPGVPSETDTLEFAYPGVIYLIIDMSGSIQAVRGFQMSNGVWREIKITVKE